MQCCKCDRKPIEHNLSMIPIDPKGTENRRWVCTECANEKEKDTIPNDVREICTAINPNFMGVVEP